MAVTRQVKAIDSNANVGALGRVINQVKELLKTQIGIFTVYMQVAVIGVAVFAAMFLPTVFGIKTSGLKNEITQYDISISNLSSKIEEIDSKIHTIEVVLPIIGEIHEDGKTYKIIGSNGK